ncbi:MAG: HDIG domain-containing protein [Phycisphaerae bacterium]
MWPFGKPSARRQDIRRSRVERQLAWHRRIGRHLNLWTVSLTFVCALISSLILWLGGEVLGIRAGQSLSHGITARVPFALQDTQKTSEMRVRERLASPDYFTLDVAMLADLRSRLQSLLALARAHQGDFEALKAEAAPLGVALDDAAARELQRQADSDGAEFESAVNATIRRLAAVPLAARPENDRRRNPSKALLVDPENAGERRVDIGDLVYATPEAAESVAERVTESLRPSLRGTIRGVTQSWLRGREGNPRAVYVYDLGRTLAAADAAANAVPAQSLQYPEGALLVDAGPVDPRELDLLLAENAAFEASPLNNLATRRAADLSRAGVVFVVAAGLAVFFSKSRRAQSTNRFQQLTIAALLMLALALARISYVQTAETYVAVGSAMFAAALTAIVFPQRAALAMCAVFDLLVTMAARQDLGEFLVLLAASSVVVLGLRDVRYRGKTVGVGALAGLAALALTIIVGLVDRQAPLFVVRDGLWAAAMTLAAAFVVEGILPGLERALGISTSMTLLEWCDANKPLLRMMAADAPGTYNHSLLVGTLAESAADAIGANGLLARAGAYYHDIGKINKPEYFVENQTPGVSRHDRLSPAMSLLIIVGHVKDGMEMAHEYGVPIVLHRFIAEHHGTTLVEYFYHAASRQRKADEAAPADSSFRYPGPKPQSRETAVLMICDGVEGAVRAMTEPTPGRIEAVVEEIIRKRLMDGQFDECDLSFRELATIERAVVKSLNSVYHARIVYPEADAEEEDERRPPAGVGRAS